MRNFFFLLNVFAFGVLLSCSHQTSQYEQSHPEKMTDNLEDYLENYLVSDDWSWPVSSSRQVTAFDQSVSKVLIPSRKGAHIQASKGGYVHYLGEVTPEYLIALGLDVDGLEEKKLMMLVLTHQIGELKSPLFTLYVNIKNPLVSEGQRVTRGQALAQVASGKFLHRFDYPEGTMVIGASVPGELIFEARYQGNSIDLRLLFQDLLTNSK